ncbi:MAG: hypothetical protein NTX22_02215 [Ignavibacteriales bacterium]|nr:hypothetical protein [Ignavibacteriales bacterium]
MLSSKIRFFSILLFLIAGMIFISCDKKDPDKQVSYTVSPDSAASIDKAILANEAKKNLGDKIQIFDTGLFESDSLKGLVVGKEFIGDKEWGMKFYYYKLINNTPKQIFETPLLNGSFNECLVRKIKMANYNYEMIYYDSQDYFMGSGGGEVFNYLIDLNEKNVYYAHFFTTPDRPVSLYLSSNINKPDIKDFIVKHFQKDYPGLSIVNKDINLDKAL